MPYIPKTDNETCLPKKLATKLASGKHIETHALHSPNHFNAALHVHSKHKSRFMQKNKKRTQSSPQNLDPKKTHVHIRRIKTFLNSVTHRANNLESHTTPYSALTKVWMDLNMRTTPIKNPKVYAPHINININIG